MELFLAKNGTQHVHHKYTRVGNKPYVEVNVDAEDCDCNLYLNIYSIKKRYVSHRREGMRVRSLSEMMYHVCAQIANEWTMHGTSMVPIKTPKNQELYEKIKSLKGPNMVNIPPFITTKKIISPQSLKIDKPTSYLYQLFDLYYFKHLLGAPLTLNSFDNVWSSIKEGNSYTADMLGKTRIGWDEHPMGTLQELCMRKLSTYNQVYGGKNKIPNTVYSMSNLNAKYLPAIEKLIKPTNSMFGSGSYLGANHAKVLDYMVKLLNVEKFKESRVWNFESVLTKAIDSVVMRTSAGERATASVRLNGDNRVYEIDGITYKVVTGGKKAYHIEYTRKEIMLMFEMVKRGELIILKDRAWTYVPKNEVLAGITDEEIIKFFLKLRLFCIPSMVLSVLQRMVHSYRQTIERGNHIAIGMSFWFGGCQRVAQNLHCFDDDYIWFTADFEAFDTTVKAHMLMIYSYFSLYYYKRDVGDYDVYKAFLKVVADNLTLKVVHLYDDIWKLIYGGMPSGAYETSHGDSWISMYIYLQYLMHVSNQYPKYRKQIHDDIMNRRIMFYVFGDDTIFGIPKKYADIINIDGLAAFAYEFFGMKMRDLFTTSSFFSVPNPLTGNLDKKGVTFLSRYFVKRSSVTTRKDLPDVLPYREFTKIIKKYAFGDGSDRLPVDYVLASIGMAYDTFGTNRIGYEFCKFMYDRYMTVIGCNSFEEVLEKYSDKLYNKNLNSVYKKCGITIEEMKKGFPTIDSLLDRHILDESKHVFRDESYDTELIPYLFQEKNV